MEKPGLSRAIPMAILGFLLACIIVLVVRSLQSMEPVWDPGVALVLAPFIVIYFFIWGMGAFDPRMNAHEHPPGHEEHGHESAIVPAEDAHTHHEEEAAPSPMGLLGSQIWLVSTTTLVCIFIIFAIALAPLGLNLRMVNEAEASTTAIETEANFLAPLGVATFEASQLTVFVGFIIFTLVSLFGFATLLYLAFYGADRGIRQVKGIEPTPTQRRPPALIRIVAGFIGGLGRSIRNGLPGFFGYRN